jgi:hypothetical protein
MEKEVALRQQAMDSHRKRAIEAGQAVQEAKFQLEKQLEQIKQVYFLAPAVYDMYSKTGSQILHM